MQACAGPGKSTVLAWFGWNFMTCYGRANEHPKGAAVSITGENLKLNLWAELAKWRLRSPLLQRLFEQTNCAIFARIASRHLAAVRALVPEEGERG
jgi:hypothetical protein